MKTAIEGLDEIRDFLDLANKFPEMEIGTAREKIDRLERFARKSYEVLERISKRPDLEAKFTLDDLTNIINGTDKRESDGN